MPKQPFPAAVRDRWKETRESLGLSQNEVAARIGVDQKTVSRWESGSTDPGFADMIALATAYDVSLDYLAGMNEARRQEEIASPDETPMVTSPEELDVLIQCLGISASSDDYSAAQRMSVDEAKTVLPDVGEAGDRRRSAASRIMFAVAEMLRILKHAGVARDEAGEACRVYLQTIRRVLDSRPTAPWEKNDPQGPDEE